MFMEREKGMQKISPRFFGQLLITIFFSLSLVQIATAQTVKEPDDREALRALLIEVRSLRQALQTLQRMSVDTYESAGRPDRPTGRRASINRIA
jgi:hypothetical protein